MRATTALAIALMLSVPTSADAFDFACSDFRPLLYDRQLERPKPPYCVESYVEFNDEFEFSQCRSEVEDYRRKVERYIDCLKSESREAIDEFNEAVQSFNARASR